jgi:hypothetical protein
MRPVSSRLMIAVSGLAALTMAANFASAAPAGHSGGRGGFGHAAHLRAGQHWSHGTRIRTVGRGYGAGDFGRASLGRGYGSGDRGRHGRLGGWGFGYGFGGYGFDGGFGAAYGSPSYANTDGPTCCLGSAYPTASGIRAAPVAPPAVYVIGESRRSGRHGNLRRGTRGVPLEADSSMADGPSGVVTSGGARIIRVP